MLQHSGCTLAAQAGSVDEGDADEGPQDNAVQSALRWAFIKSGLQQIAELLDDNWAVSVSIVVLYMASLAAGFASGAQKGCPAQGTLSSICVPRSCCSNRRHQENEVIASGDFDPFHRAVWSSNVNSMKGKITGMPGRHTGVLSTENYVALTRRSMC